MYKREVYKTNADIKEETKKEEDTQTQTADRAFSLHFQLFVLSVVVGIPTITFASFRSSFLFK